MQGGLCVWHVTVEGGTVHSCISLPDPVSVHSGLEVTKVQTEPEEWTDGGFRFLSGARLNGGGFFGGWQRHCSGWQHLTPERGWMRWWVSHCGF